MKMKFLSLIAAVAVIGYMPSCGNSPKSAHNEQHEHEGHDHESEQAHEHEGEEAHEHEHEGEAHAAGIIKFTPEQAKHAGLKVETVQPGTFSDVIRTGGAVIAAVGDESTVVAPANGTIHFMGSVSEGSPIGSGVSIATVSAAALAEGDQVARLKIEYEAARSQYERDRKLVVDKIVSAKDFEQSRQRYETAYAAYRGVAPRPGVRGAAAHAPISGYIKERLVGEGEYVTLGQPIATVTKNRRLQLRAEVSEKYFDVLSTVRSANFRLPYSDKVYSLKELNGRLLSYGRTASGASHYLPVTFEFDNKGDIVGGSYAEIYLLTSPREGVITLSRTALTEEQGLYFVYLQLDEDCYRKQEVKFSEDNGEQVLIASGLKPGDRVVTVGALHVKLASASGSIPGHTHNH